MRAGRERLLAFAALGLTLVAGADFALRQEARARALAKREEALRSRGARGGVPGGEACSFIKVAEVVGGRGGSVSTRGSTRIVRWTEKDWAGPWEALSCWADSLISLTVIRRADSLQVEVVAEARHGW